MTFPAFLSTHSVSRRPSAFTEMVSSWLSESGTSFPSSRYVDSKRVSLPSVPTDSEV